MPSDKPADDFDRATVRRWAGAGALLVAYATWLRLGHGVPRYADASNFLSVVGPLALLGMVAPAILRAPRGRARRAGVALALAVLGFQAGQLIFAIGALGAGVQAPVYAADVAFMVGYAGLAAGMLLLPWRFAGGAAARGRAFLDAATSTAAIATYSWFFVLGPALMAPTDLPTLAWALRLVYPLLDLTCVFLILLLAATARHRGVPVATMLPLAAASLFVAVGNIVFSAQLTAGTYAVGNAVDLVWPAGNMLVALAVWHLCRRAAPVAVVVDDAVVPPSRLAALLPYALVIPTVGLAMYASRSNFWGSGAVGARTGAVAVVGMLLIRQLIVIAENERLYARLQETFGEIEQSHDALAVANAQLAEANERLRSLATTDAMTRLANHRAMQDRLREEVARSGRTAQAFALLLIDVDHFKSLNDAFGHPAGDEVLRTVASLIRDNVRAMDLPARYGGEEFAVVCPNVTAAGVGPMADRVRAAIAAHPWSQRTVTVSIGASGTDVVGLDADALIRSADASLYASKRTGRDRVTIAEPPAAGDVTLCPSQETAG
jgi:diguanylate cyclase (GGDEF)-like protein